MWYSYLPANIWKSKGNLPADAASHPHGGPSLFDETFAIGHVWHVCLHHGKCQRFTLVSIWHLINFEKPFCGLVCLSIFSKVLVIGIIYWLVASCRLMGGWIPSSWDIGTGPNRPASRTPTIRQDFWSGFICHISALETHAVHVWLWFWSFFTPKPDGFMAKIEHFYALHNSHTLMRYASTI